MGNTQAEALEKELLSAVETGQLVDVPPSQRPGFDLNMAYEVEGMLKQSREASGHRAVGRKVGYANKAMWRVLKLETLVWAHMYEDTVHYTDNNSLDLTIAHPRSLKIEPEIVFGLKQAVTEGADAAAALASVDWLALGFEIIDCPFPDWKFQPGDFVASFGLHAALGHLAAIPGRAFECGRDCQLRHAHCRTSEQCRGCLDRPRRGPRPATADSAPDLAAWITQQRRKNRAAG